MNYILFLVCRISLIQNPTMITFVEQCHTVSELIHFETPPSTLNKTIIEKQFSVLKIHKFIHFITEDFLNHILRPKFRQIYVCHKRNKMSYFRK